MRDTIIIFTERYPNEYIGGAYEEKEITNLYPHFKRVFVINPSKTHERDPRYFVPSNLVSQSVKRENTIFSKIWSCRLAFSKLFYREIAFIKNTLKIKLRLKIISVFLIELNSAIRLKTEVKKILKRNNIDASQTIIYSFWNDYRAIAAALLKKENGQFAAISRAHAGDIEFERHPNNYLPLKQFVFNQLNGIFPISELGKKYLIKKLDHKKDNIFTIRLGVENNFERTKYVNSRTLKIISCSHIIPIKRIDLIINGLSLINDISIEWRHFGRDKLNGTIYKLAQEKLIANNQDYKFLGLVENRALINYYCTNQQDVFINTSVSEGISVSIMEAMSFGIPVIATAVGGTPEIVKDGYNGFLLPSNPSSEEVAETLIKFYNLPFEKKLLMRENAYNTWFEEYNAEKNYEIFVDKVLGL